MKIAEELGEATMCWVVGSLHTHFEHKAIPAFFFLVLASILPLRPVAASYSDPTLWYIFESFA